MQVVGAIIRNHEDEYLLQLRDDEAPTFKNKWTLFGGRAEDGELPEEALLRELEEELSIPRTAIESLIQVQINNQENGIRQHIYEVMTGIALNQLVLGEGAEMRYVSRELLFDREFAFNIEDVLKAYTATMK